MYRYGLIAVILILVGCNDDTKFVSTKEKGVTELSELTQVVLVIWDGCQRAHLQELLATQSLPHLQALINEGMYREMEINTTNCSCINDGDNYHTETGPGHAAMFTGYGYPITGNHANSASVEYAERGCEALCHGDPACYAELGPHEIAKGYTLFERLMIGRPEVRQGIVTGKDLLFFPFPEFRHVFPDTCCSGAYEICGVGYTPEFCHITGDYINRNTIKSLSMLTRFQYDSFFIVVHSYSPDGEGHSYGENAAQYSTSIIANDTHLGVIMDKLQALGIYEDTILIVTTDHGFIEGGIGHHYQCNADTKGLWIVSNHANVVGNMQVSGWQTALTPTLFDVFGLPKDVDPPFPSESMYLIE